MVDKQKELKLLLQSLLTWVFPSCTSEAASISGSVDDVVEDELLWDQRYLKKTKVYSPSLMSHSEHLLVNALVWTIMSKND